MAKLSSFRFEVVYDCRPLFSVSSYSKGQTVTGQIRNTAEGTGILNRRTFMAGASGMIAAGAMFGQRASGQSGMAALEVIGLINSAMSAANSFTQPGGGMEAMLRAQNAKLDIIIGQLNTIHSSVTALRIDVQRLPSIFSGLLRSSVRDELIADVVGAASRYVKFSWAASRDSAYPTTELGKSEIRDILFSSEQARAKLAATAEGRGPEAASPHNSSG